MKKSLDRIKEILKKHEKELKEKYGIKEFGIFGSYLRGEAKEESLDILVEFEHDAKISLYLLNWRIIPAICLGKG